MSVEDLAPYLVPYPDAVVIWDDYEPGAGLLDWLATGSWRLVIIDDANTADLPSPDVILNFTVGAEAGAYRVHPNTLVLAGPGFYVQSGLNQRIRHKRDVMLKDQADAPMFRAFVCMSGTDPGRLMLRVAGALRDLDLPGQYDLVVTGDTTLVEGAEALAQSWNPTSCSVYRGPRPLDPFWASASVAIVGGGLLKYEAVSLGIPSASISLDERQAADSRLLAMAGTVADLGLAEQVSDSELRGKLAAWLLNRQDLRRQSEACRLLIPEDSTQSVVRAIRKHLARRLPTDQVSQSHP